MTGFDALLPEAARLLSGLNGLAPCLRAYRQNKVLQAYEKASQAATTEQQRSQAELSLCSAHLIFAQKGNDTVNGLACVQHAVSHLVVAARHTSVVALLPQYEACRASARDLLADADLDLNQALSFWARVVSSTAKEKSLKGKFSLDQAEWILDYGQRCMAEGPKYKIGLKCGYEAEGPVESAISSARQSQDMCLIQKAQEVKGAIHTFIMCTCESVQARVQAERKLDGFGTHPDEEQVWQVVDMLAQALRQTREQDILNECRAHAKLGQVFDKYLKMRSKAVQNCKRAVQLAHHVKPHPVGHDWYMDCQAILVRIQKEQKQEEQAKQEKHNAAILQELEPQLKKLRAAKARGARDLLVHLKQNHPPKFKDKRPEPAYDDIRQGLRKAVAEYHPDKQLQYSHNWQILSEEISKAVNEVWADYCS